MKKLATILLFAVMLAVTAVSVQAADVDVEYIRVDGEQVDNNDNVRIDIGEALPIRVKLQANADVDDVEVMARLVGYEYADREGSLIDVYGPFDLNEGDTEIIDLDLDIPVRADKDEYELRIMVQDRRNDYANNFYTLRVNGPRTGLRISDVIFSPGGSVEAGRALLVQARVENLGTRDLDDVKITAAIPSLGIEGSVFLDQEIDGDEFGDAEVEVSEEILLRVPQCADEGSYQVRVTAEFDEYEEATVLENIYVYESGACSANGNTVAPTQPAQERTVVTPPQSQTLTVGEGGASYPVVVTNLGSSAKTYVVTASGLNGWGVAEVSEPGFVVQPGQSKIVYVFVSAEPNTDAGQRVFNIAVNDQSFPVVANIEAAEGGAWLGLQNVLEIGLIILIVILILLALIVGFSRMRGDDGDDEGKTYY